MSSIAPFNLGTAPLLGWASQHGDPLDPRVAEAVVGLLALSGARRRTGLPEPAPELVKELMLVLLPLYVSAIPAELAGYPAVLVALIGYAPGDVRARHRLVASGAAACYHPGAGRCGARGVAVRIARCYGRRP